MGQDIARVEPISLPDLTRGRMPSLPAWAARSRAALATNMQGNMVAGFQEILTLPTSLLPNQAQRAAIDAHLLSLNSSLNQTPENGENWAMQSAEVASKLLKTLGGEKRNELSAEAKGEAYADSLDDVPWWAVKAAARSWYRGDCGKDDSGKPYNYGWPPDPALLRKLAMQHVWALKAHIADIEKLLNARPYIECSTQYEAFCNRGHAAMRTVFKAIAAGNSETLKGMSIDDAAELGRVLPALAQEIAPPKPKDEAA